MVKKFFITGDTHGANHPRVKTLIHQHPEYQPEEMALIILGDAGFNYFLDNRDSKDKKVVNRLGVKVYCVRGNHEQRPELIEGMKQVYDEDVQGFVYYESKYPNIRYFKDGRFYMINDYYTLVLGGAYSVDKDFRLRRGSQWFEQEQLSETERNKIMKNLEGEEVDLVLSHTCPISWEPIDLFLNSIDQSEVDKSMELWLEEVKYTIDWDVWCFGHFHADRLERPGVEMFFNDIEDLDVIIERWRKFRKTQEVDWWLEKSPQFYYN